MGANTSAYAPPTIRIATIRGTRTRRIRCGTKTAIAIKVRHASSIPNAAASRSGETSDNLKSGYTEERNSNHGAASARNALKRTISARVDGPRTVRTV